MFDSHVLFRLQRYVLLFKLKAKIVSICLVSGFLYGNDNDNANDDGSVCGGGQGFGGIIQASCADNAGERRRSRR